MSDRHRIISAETTSATKAACDPVTEANVMAGKTPVLQQDAATAVIQYDLFGEIESLENAIAAAASDAIAFIIETPWPGLLAWWLFPEVVEARLDRGEVKANYRRGPDGNPGWAWAVWSDGLRFESGRVWKGWDHRPAWCIPWTELDRLRASRPEVTKQLQGLAADYGEPRSRSWRWWMDPAALHPGDRHPSHLETERQPDWYDGCPHPETAYADRIAAWNLALDAVRTGSLSVTKKGH